nr:type II NADH:quinone oxidoreductase NdhA-like [Nerophis lumbriciformis]
MAGLSPAEIAIPIRSVLGRYRNVTVLMAKVDEINLDERRIELDDGSELLYDRLIFAVGARTHYFGHDDWAQDAPGLKTIDDAVEIRRRVLTAFERAERTHDEAERRRLTTFVVIGGGPTGVEVAGALAELAHRVLSKDFRRVVMNDVRVILVEGAEQILAGFDDDLRASACEQLEELGVEIMCGDHVTAIDEEGVVVGQLRIKSHCVVWGAGVAPNPLAAKLDTPKDNRGRIIVESDCALTYRPEAFAIGDVARFETPDGAVLPGVSPVAMQQARYVADVIVRGTPKADRRPFEYLDKGMMATIGRSRAVAESGPLKLTGLFAWLAWLFIHIWYLVGFKNRIFVLMQWVFSYVVYRRGARLITGSARGEESPSGSSSTER